MVTYTLVDCLVAGVLPGSPWLPTHWLTVWWQVCCWVTMVTYTLVDCLVAGVLLGHHGYLHTG